jgi:methionyl-tRNA formyltransferase
LKRILFVGTTRLSDQTLKQIYEDGELEIAGILTGEENFKISYSDRPVQNFNFADLASFAESIKVPCYVMTKGMQDPELQDWTSRLNFDFVLVVGWYHMIPKTWLKKYDCLGIHASLLPRYRGGAPLVWAMINGETETGVSLFLMDEGVDTGPVLAQKQISITEQDTIKTLLEKVAVEVKKICKHELPVISLQEKTEEKSASNKGDLYPQRSPKDGKITFPMNTFSLSRFIRAQTHPYPGAYLERFGKKLYFWDCSTPHIGEFITGVGEIAQRENGLVVQCLDGLLPISKFSLVVGEKEVVEKENIYKKWLS